MTPAAKARRKIGIEVVMYGAESMHEKIGSKCPTCHANSWNLCIGSNGLYWHQAVHLARRSTKPAIPAHGPSQHDIDKMHAEPKDFVATCKNPRKRGGYRARRKVRHEVLPKIELQLAANTKLGLFSRVAQIREYAKKYFDYTWMLQRKHVHQGVTYGYFWWEANAKNVVSR